jgi:hypothetical protein
MGFVPKTKRRPSRPLFAGWLIGEGDRDVNIDDWSMIKENSMGTIY